MMVPLVAVANFRAVRRRVVKAAARVPEWRGFATRRRTPLALSVVVPSAVGVGASPVERGERKDSPTLGPSPERALPPIGTRPVFGLCATSGDGG